ncbi:Acetamidase [Scheffersomyces xylosifermentans]|uniref:Acetamidase n=1 Tax=Scheffersomyces xylosifermentans TaxID=1304137 RepID=UPI00315CE9AD
MTIKKPTYAEIAAKKVKQRDAKFIKEWLVPDDKLPSSEVKDVLKWIQKSGFLSSKEIEITQSNITTILANIKAREWTSVEVTAAFCHRATIAHQLTNCLSEIFFEDALIRAAELDKHYEETGQTVGPLHGLPISLKDNFNVKGQATTLGIVNFCFNPEKFDEDAVLVKILREKGAVFYLKTNVPVAMMMPESNNHIWGNTTNPLNRSLSSGGSSGGEASLIKLRGSPMGVGSDIGGSIRIPASFQNLYAIKPTFGRFPTYGARSGLPGLESVNSVNGPLGNSLDDLEYYCRTVVESEPWFHDAKCIEIPWRKVELPGKLNIAICADDGFIRPTPPIRRAVKIVEDALREDGHDVIEWVPEDHLRLSQIISAFFLSDGGVHVKQETEATGESIFPYMKPYENAVDIPVSELWKLQAERTHLIKKYLDRWNATAAITKNGKPIDAIIMPVTPFAGNPNGKFHDYVGYTSPFNVLDYSVGIFPVTRADKDLDAKDEQSTNYNESDRKIWDDYNPEANHGGAAALQLIGRKFQEEKVIEMMKVVSQLINYSD